jgi:hypothetical protein
VKKLIFVGTIMFVASTASAKLGYSPFGRKPFGSVGIGGGFYIDPFAKKPTPRPTPRPTEIPPTPMPTATPVPQNKECTGNVEKEVLNEVRVHIAQEYFDQYPKYNGPFHVTFLRETDDWMSVDCAIEGGDPGLCILKREGGRWRYYMHGTWFDPNNTIEVPGKKFYIHGKDYIPASLIFSEK